MSAHAAHQSPNPDFSKLWTELKADLDRWKMAGGFDKPHLDDESLAEIWEIMQRREEQSGRVSGAGDD